MSYCKLILPALMQAHLLIRLIDAKDFLTAHLMFLLKLDDNGLGLIRQYLKQNQDTYYYFDPIHNCLLLSWNKFSWIIYRQYVLVKIISSNHVNMIKVEQNKQNSFFFEIKPNRSLYGTQRVIFFTLLFSTCLIIGLAFFLLGATLILPFPGLEGFFVSLGFYANFKWGRRKEVIYLSH